MIRSISGDWVLYGENRPEGNWSRVNLFNLTTGEQRTLAESTFRAFSVDAGQVAGDYAVYGKGPNVFVYRISTGNKTKVPVPKDRWNYTPAVTADGTVYFVRSGEGCGVNVRIYRWSLLSPATSPVRLTTLPSGKDTNGRLYAFNDGTSTTLYFDRYNCRTGSSDIYNLPAADTATSRVPVEAGPSSSAICGAKPTGPASMTGSR